jgi:hypothetical protein
MTTDELIAACADAGAAVTVTQLARWVRAGLIPSHLRRRHSRGRGRGIEWLWEAECVPRALVIARTLASGDPSLKTAAVALAGTGYAPLPERLREVLVEGLGEVEQSFVRRQTYLKQPHEIAATRYVARLRRKTHDLPPPFVESLSALGLAMFGLDAPGGAGQYLSFAALRRAVGQVEDGALLAAYEDAGRLLVTILPVLLVGMNLSLDLAAGRATGRGPQVRFNVETIVEDIHVEQERVVVPAESPAGLFRLAFTVGLVALQVYGDALITAVSTPLLAFGRALATYAERGGQTRLSHLLRLGEEAPSIPKQESSSTG